MLFFLSGIQSMINLLFLVIVLGTLGVSWVFAQRLRKQHGADFPWHKTAGIVGIEVLIWIGFNIFWEFFKVYWLPISIIAIVIIYILSRKKRRHV